MEPIQQVLDPIEIIEEMWDKDSIIDSVRLDQSSLERTPLFTKYLKIYNKYKRRLFKLERDYKELNYIKTLYYSGKMTKDELEEREWEPYRLKVLRNDLKMYCDGDKDLNVIKDKIEYNKIVMEYLATILDQVNKRSYDISSAIKWRQFENGERQ